MPLYPFRAYHLTDILKLGALKRTLPEEPKHFNGRELAYDFGNQQFVIAYNFGSIVFYNVPVERQERILSTINKLVPSSSVQPTSEDHFVTEGTDLSVDFNKVTLPEINFETISIVGLILARSAALDYFEKTVDEVLHQSGAITDVLEKKGRIHKSDKETVKFIGFCMRTKHQLLSATYLLDSPEPAWDNPLLARLFNLMSDHFELRERYRTLEHKLEFVQDMQEVLSDLSYARRSLGLELAIVAMIALEIFVTLYRLFMGGPVS